MMFVDSHCHLDSTNSAKRPEELIREAELAGVKILLTPATDVESSRTVREISEANERVYHAVGIHPHEASKATPGDLEALEALTRHPKCKAIGEIGLDYHYAFSPRTVQIALLRELLALATRTKLPVIIHSREAEEDLLSLLREHHLNQNGNGKMGVIHCFSGTRAFGEACLELGFYISFAGMLTFKNAMELQECARAFPLERILIETDAPYLAPVPFRGRKCEPSMLPATAAKLAELRGISLEEVAHITTSNALALFGIT